MTDSRPRAIRLWRVTLAPERAAHAAFAGAYASMLPYVLKSHITAIFEAVTPSWADKRRDTYVTVWGVHEDVIEIEEEEVAIYRADRDWMSDVYVALLSGDITVEDPYGLVINFYGQPVTYEP